MTAGDNDSRAKMVRSAASLFSARGMTATSFSDVVADSGAPRGSIYHHFPEGKAQLTEEAIRWVAERVAAHQSGYSGTTAAGVLERFIGMWRNVVTASQGKSGCALAGVVVDTGNEEQLLAIARAGFRSWIDILTGATHNDRDRRRPRTRDCDGEFGRDGRRADPVAAPKATRRRSIRWRSS